MLRGRALSKKMSPETKAASRTRAGCVVLPRPCGSRNNRSANCAGAYSGSGALCA